VASSSPLCKFTSHNAAVKALAWNPHCGSVLASGGGSNDRCIKFWNVQENL
jgi:cell division cycle 20-like protein 1 (cofactor of APC complex)